MTKEELAQKIKDSNYTCDGINCSECTSVNGFGCCLQCDRKLFVHLVLGAKGKKDERLAKAEEIIRSMVNALETIDCEQVRELEAVKEAERFLEEARNG